MIAAMKSPLPLSQSLILFGFSRIVNQIVHFLENHTALVREIL